MDAVLKPVPMIALLAAIALVALGHLAIGIIVFIAWIGVLAISSMRAGAASRLEDPTELMDAESRSKFVPIRRLVEEIDSVVRDHQGSPSIKVVGGEARNEAERIKSQTAEALATRTELRKSLRGRTAAETELNDLQSKLHAAQSDDERDALQGAIAARTEEIAHYDSISDSVARIDAAVKQAQAALSEMKAKLATGASGERAEATDTEGLRETVSRLKALSVSYDEAEQTLRQ